MGYYTYYNLDVINEDKFSKEELVNASKTLARITDIVMEDDVGENHPFSWVSDESMKWYDYDLDMIKLSKAFPNMKFRLYGEGEDRDDNWIAYYYNGDSDRCVGHIIYDPAPEWAEEY